MTSRIHIILYIVLGLVYQTYEAKLFCSVFCGNQSCTSWASNACTTCFSADYFKDTTTNLCQLTSASGWLEVDKSIDAGGTIAVNFTTNFTCGNTNPWKYKFYGTLTGTSSIMFTDSTGPQVPHYQMRIIFWILLLDGWAATDKITATLNNNQSHFMFQSNNLVNQVFCSLGPRQDYIRFQQTYFHNAIAPYNIIITTNNTSLKWGVKELVVQIKTCHFACDLCFGSLVSQCTSCDQQTVTYMLSGTTCNESCLAGYGQTSGGMLCIVCDLKCKVCFEVATNCSACTINGTNAAFLYPINSSCLISCPTGTYQNLTDRTCYLCNPECLTCQFNSSYCYSCDTTLGYAYLNFSCINLCPSFYFLSNGGSNCTKCSNYCTICDTIATNCSECTLNGTYMAYLSGSSCVTTCPNQTYPDTGGGLVNLCLPCDISCMTCTASPSPCSSCSPNYYLYLSECSPTCPTGFFQDNSTWSCQLCDVYCVGLVMTMYFPSQTKQNFYVDMVFTDDIDFTTFPYTTFQSFKIDSDLYTMSMFSVSFIILSTNSYRIIVQPKGYIFLYNATISCVVMDQPNPVHNSVNMKPFKNVNYGISNSLVWLVIKTPQMSSVENAIIDQFTSISNSVQTIITQPFIQEIKKSGIFAFLLGGAQITSCSVLVNNIPAQNMYSGVRFWAIFVFFDVPEWEKDSSTTKYIINQPIGPIINNSRLLYQRRSLFDVNTLQWRFLRTGHTTFFLFDVYPVLILLLISWILMLVIFCAQKSQKWNNLCRRHAGKIFSFIHKAHEISIMYIVIFTILEWMYFDSTSFERWINLGISVIMNIYFLIYQLYIYYDMMKYPLAKIGNKIYQYYAIRYGSLLKNIRYQQYNILAQPWSPKQWFRPYNYHFLSFYKKLLMVASLPLFYHKTHAQPAALILIQIAEIARFCCMKPFYSKYRNICRFIQEIILLGFFVCVLVEGFYIQQIMLNDEATIANAITNFYLFGWIGFAFVFIFNLSFVFILLFDVGRGCSKSNLQLMDQARRVYYYAKIHQYQVQNVDVPQQTLNKWVKLGNLIQRNYEQLPQIYVRIQMIQFQKTSNNTFNVCIKRLVDPQLKQDVNLTIVNNVASKKITKQFKLTRMLNKLYYQLADQMFKQGYQSLKNQQIQVITIKTFLRIQQSKYQPGQLIQTNYNQMNQKVEYRLFNGQKKSRKLKDLIPGIPMNQKILMQI